MKSLAYTGISLALGLLFDYLFFEKVPGISVPIFIGAIICGLVVASSVAKRKLPRSALWLLFPLAFFAAMVAVRANSLLTFLNVVTCLFLLALVARISFRDDLSRFKIVDYGKIPFVPFKFLSPLGRTLAEFLAVGSGIKNRRLAIQITRGALLALPVLAVFIVLLASADLVFQKYVNDVFSLHINSVTIAQTVVVAFITLLFTGAFAYIFTSREKSLERTTPASPAPGLAIGTVEMSVLLGSVSVLFLLFILVQFAYLFGGQANISAQGFTYAQYARKGFFELLAVAVVAFGMLWAADKTTTKSATGHSKVFQLLSSLLVFEVILIMVSAFKRLYLYEQAFGFTTLRLYSHVFVVFLAVIFVLLLIKILRNQSENRFTLPAFIAVLGFLVTMNLLNPDSFIASQNLDRFHQTGKLDSAYMASLSVDARPQVEAAINQTSGASKEQLIRSLNNQTEPSDWQSWNVARNQAANSNKSQN